MSEMRDPYFEERLQRGRQHRVLRTIEIPRDSDLEVESNKWLSNPALEGTIEDFGWSKKSVENIIDALESGKIKIVFLERGQMRIEFLPIHVGVLPTQLGHVSELDVITRNLKSGFVFGTSQPDKFTFLQTTDFAVEGYMDDEAEGKEYGRVYVDSGALSETRNIYLDPESLHVTDYEYGFSYCVKGGIPFSALIKIDVIKAKKLSVERHAEVDESDWLKDPEAEMKKQATRLRDYLEAKLRSETSVSS